MFESLPGLLANTLICLLLVPQFVRLVKHKDTSYISIPFLLMVLPAASVWGIYGWFEKTLFIVGYSGFTCLLTLVFMIAFMRQQRTKGEKRALTAMPYMRFNF